MEFFRKLFDTGDFPARWNCGLWTEGHGWLHILSDLAIWAAYFAIPIALSYFLWRRKDIPFRSIFLLFVAFIVSCGTTHLIEAAIFWWPVYRLAGVVKLATAVVSWVTVFALIRTAPAILSMRSAKELDRLVEARTRELVATSSKLRAERELLQTTLTSIGDAVITTDEEGRITNMNVVAESWTGWSAEDSLGQPLDRVFQIVNEMTRSTVENPATRVLREGQSVGLANHTVLISKDGTERPIEDSAAPIRSKHGQLVGCVLVFRDTTERRRAEERLRLSEERHRALIRATAQVVWTTDSEGRVVDDSPSWREFTGQTLEEWKGWGWLDALHPDDRESARKVWIQAVESRTIYSIEYRLRRHDGEYRWTAARSVPVLDPSGEVREWVGMNTDVTDRKQSERALQESELRYRLVGEVANDAIWDWDLATNQVTWNDGVRRAFGYSPEAVDSDVSWWKERIHPEDRERVAGDIRAIIEGSEELWSDEYRFLCADGSYATVIDRGRVVRHGGRAERMVGSMLDLTERKQMEDQLRHLAAELSEANRRKDEFLATLAHELRNPLAPIRTGLELMKLSGDDPAVFEQCRAMMERQLEQMVRIIDDLMDVSRITSGRFELRKQPHRLTEALDSAIESTRPLFDAADHELTVQQPSSQLVLHADPIRISQVFANLLSNAAKYTDRGGRIHVAVERRGDEVEVSVRDNGIGIPSDKLEGIFEMFSQVDASLERSQSGLGIGLTLVRRLVEMHGGTIEAKSDGPGRGAELVVRLPLMQEPSVPVVDEPEVRESPSSALSILVVDDNRDGADSLSTMLRMMGNLTDTAYNGLAAVEAADRLRPDIVLLDIGLPGLNGYEVARRIRERPWGKSVVLVAVTGWGQEADRRRAQASGFDHHMVKPIDPDALMKLLSELNEP
ncbi:MAG: PAS domain S-box protein [Planctomycetota bacterium]